MRRLFSLWVASMVGTIVTLLGLSLIAARNVPASLLAVEVDSRILRVDIARGMAVDISPDDTLQYRSPTWAPDGTRLAFFGRRPDAPTQIFVLDMTTEILHTYNAHAEFNDTLQWAPDGRHLLFVAENADPRRHDNEAALLQLSSGDVRLLTSVGYIFHPTLSPDGHWLTYRSRSDVFIASAQTSEWHRVIDNGFSFAESWSDDSATLSLILHGYQPDLPSSSIALYEPQAGVDILHCTQIPPNGYAQWSPSRRYVATHITGIGLVVADFTTCERIFTHQEISQAVPHWLNNRTLMFASDNVLYHADIFTGMLHSFELDGRINSLNHNGF